MKKLVVLILFALATVSCSKKIIITDTNHHDKKITIKSNISVVHDTVNFTSVKGTHYHISLLDYDVVIK